MDKAAAASYTHRLRNRACGICIEDGRLLMVKLQSVGSLSHLWLPPGGGIEFGETAHEALCREMQEETGLEVEAGPLMFVYEFIRHPIHALELFFEVHIRGGRLALGHDPELPPDQQMLKALRFMSFEEIKQQNPRYVHGLFNYCNSIEELKQMRGFFSQSSR